MRTIGLVLLLLLPAVSFAQAGRKAMPLVFEANAGQTHSDVRYLSRTGGQTLFLTKSNAVLSMVTGGEKSNLRGVTIRMGLRNSLSGVQVEPMDPLPGKVNYFLGNDPTQWKADIPTYAKVAYRNVYRGIDLVYYGSEGRLEYDFVAKPGSDPNSIEVEFEGADKIHLDTTGDLILESAAGPVRWKQPSVYQMENGKRKQIAAKYRVGRNSRVGFEVETYDRKLPLVIDPVLVYSTYFGGSDAEPLGVLLQVAPTGMYLGTTTYSANFPTTVGAWDRTLSGTYDVGVSKLNAQMNGYVYSTYVGGSSIDGLNAIQIGADGSAYLAGFTGSTNFPTTTGAFDRTANGNTKGFITRLNSAGNGIVFSTYLGGTVNDDIFGMALDTSGNIFVCGGTKSANFPTTAGSFQPVGGGGVTEGFVAKLNSTATSLIYASYLGGSGDEYLPNPSLGPNPPQITTLFANNIQIDSAGNAYVFGVTNSNNFPTTSGAYSRVYHGGGGDGYVTKISPSGSSLIFSTYIGSSGFDAVAWVAVEPSGSILVSGTAGSSDFPTTAGAYNQTFNGGSGDAFLLRLDSSGSAVSYSTFLGGSAQEVGGLVSISQTGDVMVSGLTFSSNFPTIPGTYQPNYLGNGDIFITIFDSTLTHVTDSTYFGSSALDTGGAYFAGDIFVAGKTSGSITTTNGALQPGYGGGTSDAFFAQFSPNPPCQYSLSSSGASPNSSAASGSFSVNTTSSCAWTATPNANWISITSGGSGTGSGTVNYSVQANTGATRTGTITVGTQTYTIQQAAACTFTLGSSGGSFTSGGGPGSFTFTASGANCSWTATSDAWIVISSSTSGTGGGSVNFNVLANTGSARSGAVTIGGQFYTITQSAPSGACTFTFAPPTAFIVTGGSTQAVTITASAATCAWTAISNDFWISLLSTPIGTGSGSLSFSVQPNPGPQRTGSISIGGTSYTVIQSPANSGCNFALGTNSASFTFLANTGTVSVMSNCIWSAISNVPWIAITSSGSGLGYGSVSYAVQANPGATRVGTLTIAGLTFTVTQSFGAATAFRFVPVTPCRIADTRNATGQFGGPVMQGGSTRTFNVPQSNCGIPSSAGAFSLNTTVVPRGGLSYLTLWPAGQGQPYVSTLNSPTGAIVANAAIVPAGANGGVSVFVTDTTDVILDINGYFDSSPGSASFYPVTPCRLADTRNATGPFGGPSLPGDSARSFAAPQSGCSLPASAIAYSLNTTVVPLAGSLAYLTLWPTGVARPLVSTLNSFNGAVVANAAIVPSGTAGGVSAYVTNPTDLILDTNGYFSGNGGPGGLQFYPVTPCRISDTRNPVGAFGGPSVNGGATRDFQIPTSSCGIPATAQAYSLNVTVVPQNKLSYLTMWPSGTARPLVSTLNAFNGGIVANAAIVPAGVNGSVSIFVTDLTDVILDINGFFAP